MEGTFDHDSFAAFLRATPGVAVPYCGAHGPPRSAADDAPMPGAPPDAPMPGAPMTDAPPAPAAEDAASPAAALVGWEDLGDAWQRDSNAAFLLKLAQLDYTCTAWAAGGSAACTWSPGAAVEPSAASAARWSTRWSARGRTRRAR